MKIPLNALLERTADGTQNLSAPRIPFWCLPRSVMMNARDLQLVRAVPLLVPLAIRMPNVVVWQIATLKVLHAVPLLAQAAHQVVTAAVVQVVEGLHSVVWLILNLAPTPMNVAKGFVPVILLTSTTVFAQHCVQLVCVVLMGMTTPARLKQALLALKWIVVVVAPARNLSHPSNPAALEANARAVTSYGHSQPSSSLT